MEKKVEKITLDDYERRMINMSSLKSASRIHSQSGDPETTLKTAEKFVEWILNYKAGNMKIEKTPATEKQKEYMKRLGIDFDENISKDEASRLIDEKLKAEKKK